MGASRSAGRPLRRARLIACLLGILTLGAAAPSALASGSVARAARAQGAAPGSQAIALVLPLRADEAGLSRFALAVSTPGSAQYGQYESLAALAGRFGASRGARSRVLRFLRAAGATAVKIDATGLFADATLTAGLAARLFGAPLERFRAADASSFIAPTTAPSVPAPLRGLITGVVGLDTRPVLTPPPPAGTASARAAIARPRARGAQAQPASGYLPRTGVPAGCSAGQATGGFTPNQYLTAYDYDPLRAAGLAGRGERVALIEIDGFRYSDITTFASCFGLPVPAIRGFGVGLRHPLVPGPESTLDVEILDAAAPGLKGIDVYESGARPAEALRAFTAPLQIRGGAPQVVSASLGLCEPEMLKAVGAGGIRATEGAFQMAAASGITFLASSGDSGSAGCLGQGSVPLDRLAVNYPSSSRWVTGVGGTNFVLGSGNQTLGQIVWNDTAKSPGAAGGGGFSTLFRRPSYQRRSVAPNRRSVPDVSMLADIAPGYAIYCSAAPDCVNSRNSDPWTAVGGTSTATPLLAGGLALVDQELRLHGRQALGLANPLVYDTGRSTPRGEVFDDVTEFGNDVGPYIPGNGRALGCCQARPGFDAASGWGSVDLARFAAVALRRQPKFPAVGVSLPRGQHPVSRAGILATVSCSRGCLVRAVAVLRITGSGSFAVNSSVVRLRGGQRRTVSLRFSSRQLRALRSASNRRLKISGEVVGAVVDPGANIERVSRKRTLAIRP